MEPINVEFGGKGKKAATVTPPGSTAKRIAVTSVITAVIAAVTYYFMLPPLNFKAYEFYLYIAIILISFIAVFGLITKAYFRPEYMGYAKSKMKVPVILLAALAAVVGIGYLTGAVIFRAKAYHDIIKVEEGDFAADVAEIDFSSVPRLDKDASNVIATKVLGDLPEYVSQFIVSQTYSTQINYRGTPVRVQAIEYDNIFKWFSNTKNGIPAYIIVDMTTRNGEVVRLDKPMKYSPCEHFNEYLMRHVRFKYPTLMFDTPSFEIDDEGNPYWIVPVLDKTIGLFGGTDVSGAVLVDAVTGDTTLISTSLDGKTSLKTDKFVTDEEFQWIDRVYSASILNEQYNYYGRYGNGFFNSVLSQKDVKVTSEGYNYLALNDDVYMYTGITSISSDQSIIGFVLINQRTKEAKYYQISGALEIAAEASAEGKVQEYGYDATFPLLLNVSGEPTYFIALKDATAYVKMYAMVNVKQPTVVSIGSNITECMENYASELEKNGIKVDIDVDSMGGENNENTPQEEKTEISGMVDDIRSVITGGETYFYVKLSEGEAYYKISVSQAEKIVILNPGDTVTFVVKKDASGNIIPVSEMK